MFDVAKTSGGLLCNYSYVKEKGRFQSLLLMKKGGIIVSDWSCIHFLIVYPQCVVMQEKSNPYQNSFQNE